MGTVVVSEAAQPVALADEPVPDVVAVDDGISAAVVDGLFERLQSASLTTIVVVLLVIAVIVLPLAYFLYRSVPPSAIKERLGREVLGGSDRVLAGLQTLAERTPTDIDDYLIAKIRDKLHPQLQADISMAVDAKLGGSAG